MEPGRPAECVNVKKGRPLGGDTALTLASRILHASKQGARSLCRPAKEAGTQASQRGPRTLLPRSQASLFGFIGRNLRILGECTQEGQGGFGPQESQGHTEKYTIGPAAHGRPEECAQDGQGGSGPQETQGCTSFRRSRSTTMGGPKECTQDGQGGHGPQETQGCTIPYCEKKKAHVVLLNDLQLRRRSSGLRGAQCANATDA